jgi:GNAT superfamily N-acetyltransferase
VVLALRAASPGDARFIAEMLVVGADWRPEAAVRTVDDVLAVPELAHYALGWPRSGDAGVIAEGEDEVPVGAAWWRFFPPEDPGFGFVNASTPEVSLGVVADWRGRGIGTRMLDALIMRARSEGLPALSLSVEKDNYAVHLYERAGFRRVGVVGGSWTMQLTLSSQG